jgi:catechol 2,3-dioxygenase-like lactoylglutathione lyase family enzyme
MHIANLPSGARAALGALGFAVADLESATRLLQRRGLPAAGPTLPWLGSLAAPLAPAPARGLHLLLTQAGPAGEAAMDLRLDHLVVRSSDPERTLALLAGRLGLELRLDRSNPAWGTRLLFFRCGDTVLEVSHELAVGITDAPDSLWGLTWRVPDVAASHARLEAAGIPVSPLRAGRKPGTRIFTIRDHAAGVPTAFIGA